MDLPDDILRFISTWLKENEYKHFSVTNKQVYHALLNPVSLTVIDWNANSCIKYVTEFTSLQILHINMRMLHQIIKDDIELPQSVNHIVLTFSQCLMCKSITESFVDLKITDTFRNVVYLDLDCEIKISHLNKIVSGFQNVVHLNVNNLRIAEENGDHEFYTFPKIQGFYSNSESRMYHQVFLNALIENSKTAWTHLEISKNLEIPSSFDWSKMEKLSIKMNQNDLITSCAWIRQCTSLKQICFSLLSKTELHLSWWTTLFITLFLHCDDIYYIRIWDKMGIHLDFVLSAISKNLHLLDNKRPIKFRFVNRCLSVATHANCRKRRADFVNFLKYLLKALDEHEFSDFAIILNYYGAIPGSNESELESLVTSKPNLNIVTKWFEDTGQLGIMVTTKNTKINSGYIEGKKFEFW